MLKAINIENFQSHRNTRIEFHTGVTVIIGSSDSGKTAVLRAVDWVVNNTPSGDSFISWWADVCTVSLELTNDVVITRKKGKGVNSYFLNDLEFTAFGQDVPSEIRQALNLEQVNFQYQLDAPFLLSDTPGEVAAYFNKIAHLSAIEKSQSYLKSEIASRNTQIKQQEALQLKKTADLDVYQSLPKIEAIVEVIESVQQKQERARKQKGEINKAIVQLQAIEQKLDELALVTKASITLQKLLFIDTRRQAKQEEIQELSRMCNVIERQDVIIVDRKETSKGEKLFHDLRGQVDKKQIIKVNASVLSSLLEQHRAHSSNIERKQQIITASPIVNTIHQLIQKKATIQHENATLTTLHTSLTEVQQKIKKITKERIDAEHQFELDFPDVCPLCGSEQTHTHQS